MVNALLEGNLLVLDISYHLPKASTDQFALVNGKQPVSFHISNLPAKSGLHISNFWLTQLKEFNGELQNWS